MKPLQSFDPLPELTDEELFWGKFEVAERYLKHRRLPPDVQAALLRDKHFWVWFNYHWGEVDKFLRAHCRDKLDKVRYLNTVYMHMKYKYVNRVLIDNAARMAESVTKT